MKKWRGRGIEVVLLSLAIGVHGAAPGQPPRPDEPASDTRPPDVESSRAGNDEKPAPAPPRKQPQFWAAVGQVTIFNFIPVALTRFVGKKADSQVSLETWKANLEQGFAYDPDRFRTNQLSHPLHGALYYAAARANGYNWWQSVLFAGFGSLTFEYFGEVARPSTNDLIMTTFASLNTGETSYRLADLVFDNTATGFNRFLHEVAGIVVAPGRSLDRLFSGDAFRVAPNPDRVRPAYLRFEVGAGALGVASRRDVPEETTETRASVSIDLRYGDPFESDLGKPFSSFWLGAEVTTGADALPLSRVQSKGNIAGWRFDGSGSARTIVAVTASYDYLDVDLTLGNLTAGVEVTSRLPLGERWDFVPYLEALADFASVQTSEEYTEKTGRKYDWGLGGGVRAGARLRRDGREIVTFGYTTLFLDTVDGIASSNHVQLVEAGGWFPASRKLALGLHYLWQSHRSELDGGTQTWTSTQIRALVRWTPFEGKP